MPKALTTAPALRTHTGWVTAIIKGTGAPTEALQSVSKLNEEDWQSVDSAGGKQGPGGLPSHVAPQRIPERSP